MIKMRIAKVRDDEEVDETVMKEEEEEGLIIFLSFVLLDYTGRPVAAMNLSVLCRSPPFPCSKRTLLCRLQQPESAYAHETEGCTNTPLTPPPTHQPPRPTSVLLLRSGTVSRTHPGALPNPQRLREDC